MTDIVIIGIIIAIIYFWRRKAIGRNETSLDVGFSAKRTETRLSNNIYEAIEQFSRICHNCKQATGWEYDYRDHAYIEVYHTPKGTKLQMKCRGDCIGRVLPSEYKWLSNCDDDNEISYVAEDVQGYVLENYASKTPSEADSLFYFYKKGDQNAIGDSVNVINNGNTNSVIMLIRFAK